MFTRIPPNQYSPSDPRFLPALMVPTHRQPSLTGAPNFPSATGRVAERRRVEESSEFKDALASLLSYVKAARKRLAKKFEQIRLQNEKDIGNLAERVNAALEEAEASEATAGDSSEDSPVED